MANQEMFVGSVVTPYLPTNLDGMFRGFSRCPAQARGVPGHCRVPGLYSEANRSSIIRGIAYEQVPQFIEVISSVNDIQYHSIAFRQSGRTKYRGQPPKALGPHRRSTKLVKGAVYHDIAFVIEKLPNPSQ